MLKNGSFTEGWETLPAVAEAGYLRNQRPNGWQLEWLKKGDPLYDDPGTTVEGIPECVHKLSDQLPADEQLGGVKALILAGDTTYKIFNSAAKFGATLSQTVTGLVPNSQATLTVPIQVHLHGETDTYGAESGVWVNGEGGWVNGFDMGDRQWYRHIIPFTVPASGEAEIVIRVKSKWTKPKDFFFDGIKLEAQAVSAGDSQPEVGGGDTAVSPNQVIYVQVPPGFTLKTGASQQANVIEINTPSGVTVQQV
ncbi:MAG: hypothetical protein KC445_17395 [Anaerolineales bacterium]|nr:hypothetical protein [Anaerolineales bacterium]